MLRNGFQKNIRGREGVVSMIVFAQKLKMMKLEIEVCLFIIAEVEWHGVQLDRPLGVSPLYDSVRC